MIMGIPDWLPGAIRTARVADGFCQVRVPSRDWAVCGYPAVAIAHAGCIHEHVVERAVCKTHTDLEQAGCITCRTLADGAHDCPLIGELIELVRA
jgi:hypothetical protein